MTPQNNVIVFDLDGTLIPGNSWYDFNLYFGMSEIEDKVLLDWYSRGIITYDQWDDVIVKVLTERGLCTQARVAAFLKTITIRPETIGMIQACKARGYITGIISGTMKQIAESVRERIGADFSYTTSEIIFDETGKFLTIRNDKDEGPAKLRLFERVCSQYGVDPAETICVGDSRNDLEMFQRSNKAVLIGGYEKLKPHAWKEIENLSEIANFL